MVESNEGFLVEPNGSLLVELIKVLKKEAPRPREGGVSRGASFNHEGETVRLSYVTLLANTSKNTEK